MAANRNWYLNSLPLKFLFAPFKMAYVIFLIVLTIFLSSLVSQTYFHQPNLLGEEISRSQNVIQEPLVSIIPQDSVALNHQVSQAVYRGLSFTFFELPGINRALRAQTPEDDGYRLKKILSPKMELLHHFNDTLKIIAIRIGNISIFISLSIILSIIAVNDGLVMRAIRQQNASRESAGIYHRAKYWRVGTIWTAILIYLCIPIVISPYWVLITIVFGSVMTFLQAKYLKKYL